MLLPMSLVLDYCWVKNIEKAGQVVLTFCHTLTQHVYSGPTLAQQNPLCWANVGSLRWANVILLICPTMAQFVGSTMAQRKQYMTHANNQQWTNVGVAIKSLG